MAEEVKDAISEELDPAKVEAELARVRENQPGQPKPPETAADTGLPEPTVEAKPVEPKPEAKPAEAKPEDERERMREGTLRRLLRERDKELAELRSERAKPAETAEAKPKEPTYEDDAGEYLRRRIESTDAELARLKAEKAQNERLDAIRRQEADFERDHPDYHQALRHLEESEVKEWEASGLAVAQVNQLSAAVEAARRGKAEFKQYADHVAQVAARADVQALADKENRSADDVAMWLVARDTYLTTRRQAVWMGAEATGSNAAETAYRLSQGRGYKPATAAAAPKPEEKAREDVMRAKEISAATESLSESGTAEGAAGPKVIRNRNQILALKDSELDELITSGSYREL